MAGRGGTWRDVAGGTGRMRFEGSEDLGHGGCHSVGTLLKFPKVYKKYKKNTVY